MRIVWLTWKDTDNPLTGGAEVVNEELAARLAAAGHDVTFLTGGFKGAAATAERRGFKIIRTGGRFTTYLTTARYFLSRRAQLKPDLVIDECNTMPYFAGWYSRVPTVMFFHMLCRQIWFYQFPLPFSLVGYLIEPLYLRLLKRGPVVTISDSTRRDLVRHGFSNHDIAVISQGIELKPITHLDGAEKFPEPTLLSLGSVRPMKRTLHILEAFRLAKRSVPGLKLKVAGDLSGPYGAKFQAAVLHHPHAADIEVLGRVTPAARLDLMRRSHLIAVTSVKEGWGLIVTEAASQGTPAVVYDVDGLRDSVKSGQTGIVTAPNPGALAEGVTELVTDPDRYQTVRTAAWEWAKTITFDRSYRDFARALKLDS